MRLAITLALGEQVHLHIGHVGAAAHEVVAHESVEVERGRRAGVHLRAHHFRHRAEIRRNLRRRAVRRFERCSFGEVEHHLEFTLVVEREHLHLYGLDAHESDTTQQHRHHHPVERNARALVLDQRRHDAVVQLVRAAPFLRRMLNGAVASHDVPLEQAIRQVRRDDERHGQRRQHGHARPHRNGTHVGSHQAAHERHRHDGRNHGERGEDGGVAHFVHRVDAGDVGGAVPHLQVAIDVLHHHDGIVYQNADGEDQREQRNAVERVPQRVVHEQRKRERDGHRHEHHQRFAPPKEQPDEQRHRNGGDEQVQNEFLRLLTSRFAVVTGDIELDARRHEPPLRLLHALEHRVGDLRGVGALPLGHGNGDRRLRRPLAGAMRHVAGHIAEVVAYIGHGA